MHTFYEFFSGGGMARLGLGASWQCLFANDISEIKATTYLANFPSARSHFRQDDICNLSAEDLPEIADLVWGSFPCQDLSLAGNGKGLGGVRSSLIWKLLDLCQELKEQGRAPALIALENVAGLLNSRGGKDFYDVLRRLKDLGYLFGPLIMDAIHFLPQSRPRLFLIAAHPERVPISPNLTNGKLRQQDKFAWTSRKLDELWMSASFELRSSWLWWDVSPAPFQRIKLSDLLDLEEQVWDDASYTERLLSMASPLHQERLSVYRDQTSVTYGTLYRRTRVIEGVRTQRAEFRFDEVSGCLRTPSGGSSRQRIIAAGRGSIRTRLINAREIARLMGLPDSYTLPSSYNAAYQVAGDGVAVPVVDWLSSQLFVPLLGHGMSAEAASSPEAWCA